MDDNYHYKINESDLFGMNMPDNEKRELVLKVNKAVDFLNSIQDRETKINASFQIKDYFDFLINNGTITLGKQAKGELSYIYSEIDAFLLK